MGNGIQQDWLNHVALQIIKGVGKTPGDTLSAEPDPVVVNLMSGMITLSENWTPNIPALENGGVWVDSPITDGRTLLSGAVGNVIEKLTVTISDPAYLAVIRELSNLNKMVSDCRDYWQSQAQTDPVYLMWQASCGAGSQYALLSNIDMTPTYIASNKPTIRVDMALEREPYWRPIPPGANPKQWTYYINPAHPQFDVNGASLVTGSDHLITQTIQNKFEWAAIGAFGAHTAVLSQNYIDISAAQVPGDAPALLEVSIAVDTTIPPGIPNSVYMGLSSRDMSQLSHDGTVHNSALILNGGDGQASAGLVVVKTAGTSAQGVHSNASSVNYYYLKRTSTGVDADFADFVTFGPSTLGGLVQVDRQLLRGSFAVFVRMTNNSAAPVLTDMRARLRFTEYEGIGTGDETTVYSQPVYPPITGVDRSLVYMGTITFPLSPRIVASPLGYGAQIQETRSNLQIALQQKVDVATANRILEAVDIILMPIDEGMAQMIRSGAIRATDVMIVDNSGYTTHGEPYQNAISYVSNANSGGVSVEARGQNVMLKPHTDQRLYFITAYSSNLSDLTENLDVRLNIVPRWAGIRDT